MVNLNLNSLEPSFFSRSIAEKFDDSNYLHWQQQVEPVIKSHKLQRFVVNPQISLHYLTDHDREIDHVNPTFEVWDIQDQMLLTWVQSTLSKSVPSHVIGCIHSYQVWDKIHEHFHM
ncbi:hypothetical protein Fmac_014851 [Flemingia macrophylla]|uniref:Retrotransposon Copia-like N-terminal domain-containing protein n=1 Tax=Flemingia macrophylla TaxID=520843 RepID=A0ABD1MCX3_9FABA